MEPFYNYSMEISFDVLPYNTASPLANQVPEMQSLEEYFALFSGYLAESETE